MAGEMLGAWVDELTKLREKAKNPKKAGNVVAKKEQKELSKKLEQDSSTNFSFQETSTLSESTMCLLLDRFVPC